MSEGVEWTRMAPTPEQMSIHREEHGHSTKAWQLRECFA